jgi:hypothetical protein
LVILQFAVASEEKMPTKITEQERSVGKTKNLTGKSSNKQQQIGTTRKVSF